MKKIIFGVSAIIMLAAATVYASTQVSKKTTCTCQSGSCSSCNDCSACTCSK
ncbi:MAG: hypothetical protein JST67_08700 [Bacteroidetes bacterium]|nr:hypothetical protein [Bacteroidota bacterium]